ncbi:hypothetical protein KBU53_14350 [Enterobacter hormaechei subsp. xiangfangensis]|nr:hypothetical protein [Enterobacter hormaechei]MDR9942266.1 hypothetical protein [Enterobacter hormaechei subsp. xiangfangensis]
MREIIVDNFAGGGGASTGIEMAIGRSVDTHVVFSRTLKKLLRKSVTCHFLAKSAIRM